MSLFPLFTPLQYASETTYGTPVAVTTAVGSVQSLTPTNANNFTFVYGPNRKLQRAVYGTYTTGLTGLFQLHDFAFLRHFVGPLSGSGTAVSPYTLTIADFTGLESSGYMQPFTLEQGDISDDTKTTYTGCVGADFSLSGSVGSIIDCSFNIISQKPTDSATATAYTEPTTLPWTFQSGSFFYGTTPTEIPEITSFSISYNNSLIQHWGGGNGRFMRQPLMAQLVITFTLTLRATSSQYQALKDNFYGASNTPTDATSSATAALNNEFKIELTEGTSARQADIWLDNVYSTDISEAVAVGGDNIVEFTLSGRASDGRNSSAFVQWWTGTRS